MSEGHAGVNRIEMLKGMVLGEAFLGELAADVSDDCAFCCRVVGACAGIIAVMYKSIALEKGAEMADRWMACFGGETRRLIEEHYGKQTVSMFSPRDSA